jgi:hypothetical protein
MSTETTQGTLEQINKTPLCKLSKLNSAVLLLLHERLTERMTWNILGIADSLRWKSYSEKRLAASLADMRSVGMLEWSGESYSLTPYGVRHLKKAKANRKTWLSERV